MRTPQGSPSFGQAVPRRHGVSLIGVCLVLVAFSVYVIYAGIQFLTTSLVGGYEVLAFAVPIATTLLLATAGMVVADRMGRDAWIAIDDGAVTLHARGVLRMDVVLPMTEITGVQSYPWQFPASQLPRGAASVTPLSMGPWLALSVAPLAVPVKWGGWMWRWLFRATDSSHVRTPSPRGSYSMILFGTAGADEAAQAIRQRLNA